MLKFIFNSENSEKNLCSLFTCCFTYNAYNITFIYYNIFTFANVLYQSELQLKPNHVPFRLTCQWDELLEKYTTAEKEDIERGTSIVNQNLFICDKKVLNPQYNLDQIYYYLLKYSVHLFVYKMEMDNITHKKFASGFKLSLA